MSAVPNQPTVLNTTAPSNFAYIDRLDLVAGLARVCTVPAVRAELLAGVDSHPYLQRALDHIGDAIPVVSVSEPVATTATEFESRLDSGEAQALAVADLSGGTLVSDDGAARNVARDRGIPVTGSIGILMIAVDGDRISEDDADRWLNRWIDETAFRAPSAEFSDYR